MQCKGVEQVLGLSGAQELASKEQVFVGWHPAVVMPSHLGPRPCWQGWAPVYCPSRGGGHAGEAGGTALCPRSDLVLSPQGKRYKNSLETVGTPDSGRGRNEKKAIK